MNENKSEITERIFSGCRSQIGAEAWENLLEMFVSMREPEEFPDILEREAAGLGLPEYLPELARLELAVNEAGSSIVASDTTVSRLTINPSLWLRRFSWKHLPGLLSSMDCDPAPVRRKAGNLCSCGGIR